MCKPESALPANQLPVRLRGPRAAHDPNHRRRGHGLAAAAAGYDAGGLGEVTYRTTIGTVQRKVPHAIARVPCLASLGSIEMVNFSTVVAALSA